MPGTVIDRVNSMNKTGKTFAFKQYSVAKPISFSLGYFHCHQILEGKVP